MAKSKESGEKRATRLLKKSIPTTVETKKLEREGRRVREDEDERERMKE